MNMYDDYNKYIIENDLNIDKLIFDKNAFSKVYDLNVADYIVTDKEFNTKDAKLMTKLGIKIIEV